MRLACVLIPTLLSVTTAQAQQAIRSNPPNLPNYRLGPTWFPTVFKPYQQGLIRPPVMENSPRLHDLIRNWDCRPHSRVREWSGRVAFDHSRTFRPVRSIERSEGPHNESGNESTSL